MFKKLFVLATLLLAGCTTTKSIFGMHPGVAVGEDGSAKMYDLENLVFLDHRDTYWHQLYLIKDGDSDFISGITANGFVKYAIDESWVRLNEFQEKRAKEAAMEAIQTAKSKSISVLDNALFVIEGSAKFKEYDFENQAYTLDDVQVSPLGTLIYKRYRENSGSNKRYKTFFQGSPTPPIVEPVQKMPFLNHTTYRSSELFLSQLSASPFNISYTYSPAEAEKERPFFASRSLKVNIVSELVSYSSHNVNIGEEESVVFQHNVLCYIFTDGQLIRTRYFENSEVDDRSRNICRERVKRMNKNEPLESANILPSLSIFEEEALTKKGKALRSKLESHR